jgi:hypothetical protein
MSAADAVSNYTALANVERAFRSFKTDDVKGRPIHHRPEGDAVATAPMKKLGSSGRLAILARELGCARFARNSSMSPGLKSFRKRTVPSRWNA